MQIQGDTGYYARCSHETELLDELTTLNLAVRKKNRKRIFILTEKGKDFIERMEYGRRDISEMEFTNSVQEAIREVTNPMRPMARIPVLRNYVTQQLNCPDHVFDNFLLRLHDAGIVTLQTAMTIPMANEGITAPNGIYAYCMLEDD